MRRESSERRSSCARNSDVKNAWRVAGMRLSVLSLVERLEIAPDLIVEVARDLLARDRVLHRLAVLADDPQVLEPRGHAAAASGQVGVVAVLAAAPRLAFDADVVGVGPQTLGRLALRRAAPASARHEPLAFAEVLVLRTRAVAPGAVAAPAATIALASPAQALARALRFVHRPHLVQGLLHGVEGAVGLASLERLHALHRIPAPVGAALATEPLHLLEKLAELLWRDLIRPEAAGERLRFAVHHLVLVVREIGLEVGQAVDLLEHPQALVALLHEAVEVRSLARQRGVLEDRREIAGRAGTAAAGALGEVALLEGRALGLILRKGPRRLLEHRRARALLALLLARRQRPRPQRRSRAPRSLSRPSTAEPPRPRRRPRRPRARRSTPPGDDGPPRECAGGARRSLGTQS